eukprot:13233291-Alexandrium_andersonii.AAC.1
MIALAELHVLVSYATTRGSTGAWAGRFVLGVSDNANTCRWLCQRSARNRLARHLVRLLRYAE